MDQLIVDCGDASVEPGDEVVLIGAQGDECVTVEELAGCAGTIGCEIVTADRRASRASTSARSTATR